MVSTTASKFKANWRIIRLDTLIKNRWNQNRKWRRNHFWGKLSILCPRYWSLKQMFANISLDALRTWSEELLNTSFMALGYNCWLKMLGLLLGQKGYFLISLRQACWWTVRSLLYLACVSTYFTNSSSVPSDVVAAKMMLSMLQLLVSFQLYA